MTSLHKRYSRRALPDCQKGASIVEVVVTVAVLAALDAIGVPAFQEWIANSRVRTTSDSILNGLQLARAEAIRRNRLVEFQLNGVDGGWQVVSAPADANCPLAAGANADDVLQSRNAQEGASNVQVVPDPVAQTRVTFSPMGLISTQCVAPFTRLDVSTAAIQNPRALRIVVNATGGVRMCEPSRPAEDPRACP